MILSHAHGFYLYNARGDVVQRVVISTGNVAMTYRYDAFGNTLAPDGRHEPTNNPGTSNNAFRFAGMHWDWERGEYMTPNRSLNPRTGRWTQPDPFWNIGNMQSSNLAILQSANLFVYVMNNPMRFIDPTGLFADFYIPGGADGWGADYRNLKRPVYYGCYQTYSSGSGYRSHESYQ